MRCVSCCIKYVKPILTEYERLFINKHPELVKEWDFEKNIDIDINTIYFSSHKKVYWVCENGHSYEASLNNRTKTMSGTDCSICKYDSKRIYDKKIIDDLRENYNPSEKYLNTIKTGDDSENYITKLLINTNKFKNVNNIGNEGGKSDIIITNTNETINHIQVKTLTSLKKDDSYYITINCTYPENMLIVMLNKERTRFAVDFARNITGKRPNLSFGSKKSKYKDIMFKDVNIFLSKLVKLIPLSCNFNIVNDCIKLEKESLFRFEQFCIDKNLEFKRNKTNGDTVDFFLNGFRGQAKFVSKNDIIRATYQVKSQKSCGSLNGKFISRNYEEKDFDFIVIEIGGTITYPDKYKNNFCIIPINDLLKQKILKTNSCKGKKIFYICPPDYDKKHWSKIFWNKIPENMMKNIL